MTYDAEVCADRMRPHQIAECRQRADVAFLPLGILEWHGVQAPIGTDSVKAHGICCEAARILEGGAVFPPVLWAVPRDSFYVGTSSSLGDISDQVAQAFGTDAETLIGFSKHGGMDVQEQWLFYQRLLRMCLEHIAGFGFRSIYICSGHNPLIHWAQPTATAFGRATKMAGKPVTIACGGEYDAAGLHGDHGGKWETSLMMALEPATVDLDQIRQRPEYQGVGAHTNAIESSREQGQAWIEACATAIAREAKWLVDHHPQLPEQHRAAR